MSWYILTTDNEPVKVTVLEAAEWMENNPNRKTIGYDELTDFNGDDVRVSTVFLGLDHSYTWKSDKPVLWETMIFGGENDQAYQERYTSYEDALEGHQRAIDLIKQENE